MVLVVSRVVLKQLFLHMNQERCSPKKGKTKRRKKERVIEINICTVNFEEVNMPYSVHNKKYPYLQYIDIPGSAVMI